MTCRTLPFRYPKTAPIAKSLASHISSKGKSQSGATIIGDEINLDLRVSKATKQSLEKSNKESLTNNSQRGLEILEKSFINLLYIKTRITKENSNRLNGCGRR